MVKQNIVFVENRAGSLHQATKLLAENKIYIYGFGCFDAPEFAIFRMVCDDPEGAQKILTENGYMSRISQVILVDLKDEIGSLDALLDVLAQSNVNLNYVYTFFHRGLKIPVAILHAEEMMVTESVLKNNGFTVLNRVD
ncbi:MAG: amino acid-binding protein [Clostridiales bacterium]|nr:amino acid-binding protein [Clostridiales bacterium]